MSVKGRFILEVYDPKKTYKEQKKFDCGNATINKFVKDSLKKQVRDNLSRCIALLDLDESDRFIGFYTLTAFAVDVSLVASLSKGRLPNKVPCTRMIMLGVDKEYQGCQLGSKLLQSAIRRSIAAAEHVGVLGLYLDADPAAVDFYLAHNFLPLKAISDTDPTPMFLHNTTALIAI